MKDEDGRIESDPPLDSHLESVSPAGIAENLDSSYKPLSPQYVKFERRTSYVVLLIVGIIIVCSTSPLFIFAMRQWWIGLLIVFGWCCLIGLFVFLAHFWPPIKYRNIRWQLNESGMEILRGVWWKHRVSVPISRVQHVDVAQGPVQRMFDLGTLTIHTAGTKNASVELEGLAYDDAVALRDQLIVQKESRDVT